MICATYNIEQRYILRGSQASSYNLAQLFSEFRLKRTHEFYVFRFFVYFSGSKVSKSASKYLFVSSLHSHYHIITVLWLELGAKKLFKGKIFNFCLTQKKWKKLRREKNHFTKMSKNCARCLKVVYPIEELKCLDKVYGDNFRLKLQITKNICGI